MGKSHRGVPVRGALGFGFALAACSGGPFGEEPLGSSTQALSWSDPAALAREFMPEFRMAESHRCFPIDPGAGEGPDTCRRSFNADFPVYVRIVRGFGPDDARIAYFVHYGEQDPQYPFGIGSHGHDVEGVVVDVSGGKVTSVRYNVHGGAYTKLVPAVELVGGKHPVVYSGRDFHASYHDTERKNRLGWACTFLDTASEFCDYRGSTYRSIPSRVVLMDDLAPGHAYYDSTFTWENAPGNKGVVRDPYGASGCDDDPICARSDDRGRWITAGHPAGHGYFKSEPAGGPGGDPFDDQALLPAGARLAWVSIRTGDRLDRVCVGLASGETFCHGGGGGREQRLDLASGETITGVEVATGKKSGRPRVFWIRMTTSQGRVLEGGSRTNDVYNMSSGGAPLVGFFGRSGSEVDQLGVVTAR